MFVFVYFSCFPRNFPPIGPFHLVSANSVTVSTNHIFLKKIAKQPMNVITIKKKKYEFDAATEGQ